MSRRVNPCVNRCVNRGVGMLEFLLALLLFSVGMLGLMATQLAGKRAGYEASQRSQATALARDMLERIRVNPGQLAAYQVEGLGDVGSRLGPPGVDCAAAKCSSEQLAAFDLWQWESLLLGESEQAGDENVGGLVSPRGCIRRRDAAVTVTISWLGTAPAGPAGDITCGSGSSGVDAPDDAGIDTTRRHQLALATVIAQ